MRLPKSPYLIYLGARIALYRNNQSLTQEECATRTGIQRSYWASLEMGTRNPSCLTLIRICDGLGITMSRLFRDIENQ